MIEALSLEPPVSEEPFLRRELGLAWTVVDEAEMRSRLSQRAQVLICSEPEAYAQALQAAPASSAVLIMISDEAYTPERLALVERHPSVRGVFRQYGLEVASTASVAGAVAGFMTDARAAQVAPTLARDLLAEGRATRRRMRAWTQVSVPVTAVPLGYTAQFEQAFALAHGFEDPHASLFDAAAPSERLVPITFRGVRGTAARAVAIAQAEAAWPTADVTVIEAGWSGGAGGDVGRTYVAALQSSRFALCPPGFVNAETFRYYEALACGALPVEALPALTHLGRPTCRLEDRPTSWRAAVSRARGMSEQERNLRVEAARTLVRERLAAVRGRIAADLEG